MAYSEFDNGEYSGLRRDLLREKGGHLQEAFLNSMRQDRLLEFMSRLSVKTGEDIELCPHPLTETEFREPPVDTQQRLYQAWGALTPSIACRSSFWGHVTCNHIREERIRSVYLAANGNHVGGAQRIDRALRETGDRRPKAMDDCVRTALRRLGGLPEARGNRTVYVDCPLARAWWREHFVEQIGRDDPGIRTDVRNVVRLNKTYWERLVVMVVSRNSVLGSHEIRNAFVMRLAKAIGSEPNGPVATGAGLVRGCRNLSALQATRELSVLEAKEVEEIVDRIISAI